MIKMYLIFIVMIVLTMIANIDIAGYSLFVFLFASMMFVEMFKTEEFVDAFENVIVVLALVSIIEYAVLVFLPEVRQCLPDFVYRGTNYKKILTSIVDCSNKRNYGLFYEPGMYAIYLGFAAASILFREKRLFIFKLIIVIGALLSTLSSAGILALGFLIAFWMFFSNKSKKIYICCFL